MLWSNCDNLLYYSLDAFMTHCTPINGGTERTHMDYKYDIGYDLKAELIRNHSIKNNNIEHFVLLCILCESSSI